MMIQISKYNIESIIDTLNAALEACDKVDYDVDVTDPKNAEKTAPYAVGYSRASIKSAIYSLNYLINNN